MNDHLKKRFRSCESVSSTVPSSTSSNISDNNRSIENSKQYGPQHISFFLDKAVANLLLADRMSLLDEYAQRHSRIINNPNTPDHIKQVLAQDKKIYGAVLCGQGDAQ